MGEREASSMSVRQLDPSVSDAARTYAYDRYLAALLSPAEAQADLVVLAAYFGEVRRIPLIVDDAAVAEIRLQWWRDALAPFAAPSGHPVADAVLSIRHRRGLADNLLLLPVEEGFSRELYEDGIDDGADLMRYAEETEGAAIRLALATIGGEKSAAAVDHLVEPAARALALTQLALVLPQHLAHGRLPVPPDYMGGRDPRGLPPDEARAATLNILQRLAAEASGALNRFRSQQKRLPDGLFAAFLPLCLVAPYLKAILSPRRDVLTDVADISPLSRVTRLWFAHWRGRI